MGCFEVLGEGSVLVFHYSNIFKGEAGSLVMKVGHHSKYFSCNVIDRDAGAILLKKFIHEGRSNEEARNELSLLEDEVIMNLVRNITGRKDIDYVEELERAKPAMVRFLVKRGSSKTYANDALDLMRDREMCRRGMIDKYGFPTGEAYQVAFAATMSAA